MATRIEGDDIVIDGFESGIAEDPYSGTADARNVNLLTTPKEVSVNFKTTQCAYGSFTNRGVTLTASTDLVTLTSGNTSTMRTADCGYFTTVVGGTGITAGNATAGPFYWCVVQSGTTFKVYSDPLLNNLVDITVDGTANFTVLTPDEGKYDAQSNSIVGGVAQNDNFSPYFVDKSGRVWGQDLRVNSLTPTFTYLGNDTSKVGSTGNGLVAFRGYLFLFRATQIDYMNITTCAWTYNWVGPVVNTIVSGSQIIHQAFNSPLADAVYFCDGNYVNGWTHTLGTTFDPTNTATFTKAPTSASGAYYYLVLPSGDIATNINELGTYTLIGGVKNKIYTWDRVAATFINTLYLPEDYVFSTVVVNTNIFIFSGFRGRIYISNGSQVQLYKKVPDFISGTVEPFYVWKCAGYTRNILYFGFNTDTNLGAPTNYNIGGLWGIDLDTKSILLVNQLSYGTYAGYPSLFIANPVQFASGIAGPSQGRGFYVCWNSLNNGSGSTGVDYSDGSTPYTNYESYIITEAVPIGTLLIPKTPTQIEFKLSKPLVSGEGVKISYRTDLNASFAPLTTPAGATWEVLTVGAISGVTQTNFEKAQWVQLQVFLKSTATTPSYTRLKEVRLR